MTPITNVGRLLSRIVRPTTPESAPNRRRHSAWPMMATVAVSDFASSGTKVRPRSGRVPSTVKKSVETRPRPSRSGSPYPVSVVPQLSYAAIDCIDRERSWNTWKSPSV